MRKLAAVLAFIVVAAGIFFGLRLLLGGPEDTWLCENGHWVMHGKPTMGPVGECK